ncbi:transposase [Streptomyces sp. NPDC058891]|uniref:transposase n=1 Tax=Streptomyces sp. NPDC058891 TaxID=3346667 RepID=UPI00368E8D43
MTRRFLASQPLCGPGELDELGPGGPREPPEYVDLPPAQIYARELDEGRYHCSERTMYRILKEAGQDGERRRQATHPPHTVPELVADGPSQVWSWDITRLAGPAKAIWYHGYVILDIYSRYIVGHTVEAAESAQRAEELIREAIDRNAIVPHTVHADRGTLMTSKQVSETPPRPRRHQKPLQAQGQQRQPVQREPVPHHEVPAGLSGTLRLPHHAREWMDAFISHYNHVHRHSGIGYHTPASVHFGTAELVREQRTATLTAAYERHPERFNRRPAPPTIPQQAWINDPARRREPQQHSS